jgi:hypothetical protein
MVSGPKAGMALVGHALLNTRKLPVFNLQALPANPNSQPPRGGNAQWVVQQMRVGWRAGFQRLKTGTFGWGENPSRKS